MICQYPYRAEKYKITAVYGKAGSWACGWHPGTDFVGLESKRVYPIAAGTVIKAVRNDANYGNYLRLRHVDEDSTVYISHYAHLAKLAAAVGDEAGLDTLLGIEGETGNASGVHLHLELHRGSWKYPSGCSVAQANWILDPDKFISLRLEDEEVAEKRFNTVDELPAWAQKPLQKLIDEGKLAASDKMDLSLDMVRLLVVISRLV